MLNRNNLIVAAIFLLLLVQAGVVEIPDLPSTKKVDRVTYVYEKDEGSVPPPISYSLRKLNEVGVVATELEVEPQNGLGEIPAQDKIAVEAANTVGLPALVVQSGDKVTETVKSPATVKQVSEATKIKIEEPQ